MSGSGGALEIYLKSQTSMCRCIKKQFTAFFFPSARWENFLISHSKT